MSALERAACLLAPHALSYRIHFTSEAFVSAFMVGNDHIDYLVTFGVNERVHVYQHGGPDGMWDIATDPQATGEILLNQNRASVNARYEEEEHVEPYTFRRWFDPVTHKAVTALQVLKACSCYDYQACETEGYEDTLAAKIIDAIRHRAIGKLPGYEDAEWEVRRTSRVAK